MINKGNDFTARNTFEMLQLLQHFKKTEQRRKNGKEKTRGNMWKHWKYIISTNGHIPLKCASSFSLFFTPIYLKFIHSNLYSKKNISLAGILRKKNRAYIFALNLTKAFQCILMSLSFSFSHRIILSFMGLIC